MVLLHKASSQMGIQLTQQWAGCLPTWVLGWCIIVSFCLEIFFPAVGFCWRAWSKCQWRWFEASLFSIWWACLCQNSSWEAMWFCAICPQVIQEYLLLDIVWELAYHSAPFLEPQQCTLHKYGYFWQKQCWRSIATVKWNRNWEAGGSPFMGSQPYK